jgi:hypothetical protein
MGAPVELTFATGLELEVVSDHGRLDALDDVPLDGLEKFVLVLLLSKILLGALLLGVLVAPEIRLGRGLPIQMLVHADVVLLLAQFLLRPLLSHPMFTAERLVNEVLHLFFEPLYLVVCGAVSYAFIAPLLLVLPFSFLEREAYNEPDTQFFVFF